MYVRPQHLSADAKGPRKAHDRIAGDWSSGLKSLAGGTLRCRVCRLDPPMVGNPAAPGLHRSASGSATEATGPLPAEVAIPGIENYEVLLRESFRSRFEGLVTMLSDQARVLSESRTRPGWDFADLFRVRDNAARMLLNASFLEDAEREYMLLERTFLEARAPDVFGCPLGNRLLTWRPLVPRRAGGGARRAPGTGAVRGGPPR